MNITDKIKLRYPLPLAQQYAAVNLETDPRFQVRRLVDLFEGVVCHLALIGLAAYTHHHLTDDNVENLRPGLARPSLGHWVKILKTLSPLVTPCHLNLLGNATDKKHTTDAIGQGTRAVAHILNGSQRKRVMLPYFLEVVVELRNKKFAHSNLIPRPQARQIVKPLEEAMLLWLDELSILITHKLVYITNVEWDGAYFVYNGYDLNVGGLPGNFRCTRDEQIPGKNVYLYDIERQTFLPLHPFFLYDDDYHLFYIYHALSNRGELTLRCPYDISDMEKPHYLQIDKSIVVGEANTPPVKTATNATKPETFGNESPAPSATDAPLVPPPSPPVADVAPRQKEPPPTFEKQMQDLETRIRQVCNSQARYPVLWVTGNAGVGKTSLVKAVCQHSGWRYVDFTLDASYLDSLQGQENSYQPEDFIAFLHQQCRLATADVLVLDELEPLLGWWDWDKQEVFFRKAGKATRLPCGVVLVTRLRSAQQLASLIPGKEHVFEIVEGVEL